jgi:hypothetical protein
MPASALEVDLQADGGGGAGTQRPASAGAYLEDELQAFSLRENDPVRITGLGWDVSCGVGGDAAGVPGGGVAGLPSQQVLQRRTEAREEEKQKWGALGTFLAKHQAGGSVG